MSDEQKAMKGALTREQRLETALAELVRLEELKGRLHFTMNELPHGSFGSRRKFLAAEEDYCTNRPLAWEAARQALASLTPPQQNDVAHSAEQMREMAAKAAQAHKGSAARGRRERGQKLGRFSEEARAEILAEERGEDIAADLIAEAIRSLPLSGQPEEQRSVHSDGDTAGGRAHG